MKKTLSSHGKGKLDHPITMSKYFIRGEEGKKGSEEKSGQNELKAYWISTSFYVILIHTTWVIVRLMESG